MLKKTWMCYGLACRPTRNVVPAMFIMAASLIFATERANAQSSVTLSGAVDNGIGYYTAGGKTTWAATNGAYAASSLALTGTEDLGAGYKASFVLRELFNSDTSALVSGLAYASESKAGLSGPFGQVQLGRLFSLNDLFFLWNSPSSSNYSGAWNMALNGYAAYWDNAVRYSTPDWHGLNFSVQHSFDIKGDATAINTHEGRGTELGANYANGPLELKGVYEEAYTEALPTTDYKSRRISVGGIYNFNIAKLHLAYYREMESGVNPAVPFDIKFIGVTVPITSFLRATAEYGYRHYEQTASHTQFTGLGVFYLLSKSTQIYAEGAFVQNHGKSSAYSIYHGPTVVAGVATTGITVELRHNF
ncbi:porin [Paraburkholderia fungorum]|uniref:porin n=1 Tax=Paraburkholderia fungorum TaxID=134537 RepID=UPI00248E8BF8|nr:porin [Paraburkholderia fungorum]